MVTPGGYIPLQMPYGFIVSQQFPIVSINKFGNGPKDWMPVKPIQGSMLLSKEEADRFNALERSASVFGDDLKWIFQIIRRLALLKFDEFDFPKYAALVNPIACNAFAMRFDGRESFRKEVVLPSDQAYGAIDLLDITTHSQLTDAIMLIRPYIRLASDVKKEALDTISKWNVTFELDGERLVREGPIEQFLTHHDGTGIRRHPFSFANIKTQCLFTACCLDKGNQVDASLHLRIMMPNGTRIRFLLHKPLEDKAPLPVVFTAGLVAANYTTKP